MEEFYINHGAFRSIAFSPAIAETTIVEYDPNLDSRLVYEDGQFIQVPPFDRPKIIELLGPYGAYLQYIIPHPETETPAKSMADKGVVFLELAFDPQEIFKELEKREIFVHYSVSSR